MDANKEIKIMIVGDFLIFRNGLRLLLETERKFKVVGEASNLAEATNLIGKIKPEILLIELTEIDDDNFDAFLSSQPEYTPIIVLSNSKDHAKLQKYLLLGVNGLISKEESSEVLFKAIRQVSGGNVWFDRKIMSDTIKQLVGEKKLLPEKLYSYNCSVLTEREREVLTLVCQGMKNKIIADNLFITETTVRHHLASIFEKLNVTSRLELAVYAFKEKLVEVPNQVSHS